MWARYHPACVTTLPCHRDNAPSRRSPPRYRRRDPRPGAKWKGGIRIRDIAGDKRPSALSARPAVRAPSACLSRDIFGPRRELYRSPNRPCSLPRANELNYSPIPQVPQGESVHGEQRGMTRTPLFDYPARQTRSSAVHVVPPTKPNWQREYRSRDRCSRESDRSRDASCSREPSESISRAFKAPAKRLAARSIAGYRGRRIL